METVTKNWHTEGRPEDGRAIVLYYKYKSCDNTWREAYDIQERYYFEEDDEHDHLGQTLYEGHVNIAWAYIDLFKLELKVQTA